MPRSAGSACSASRQRRRTTSLVISMPTPALNSAARGSAHRLARRPAAEGPVPGWPLAGAALGEDRLGEEQRRGGRGGQAPLVEPGGDPGAGLSRQHRADVGEAGHGREVLRGPGVRELAAEVLHRPRDEVLEPAHLGGLTPGDVPVAADEEELAPVSDGEGAERLGRRGRPTGTCRRGPTATGRRQRRTVAASCARRTRAVAGRADRWRGRGDGRHGPCSVSILTPPDEGCASVTRVCSNSSPPSVSELGDEGAEQVARVQLHLVGEPHGAPDVVGQLGLLLPGRLQPHELRRGQLGAHAELARPTRRIGERRAVLVGHVVGAAELAQPLLALLVRGDVVAYDGWRVRCAGPG